MRIVNPKALYIRNSLVVKAHLGAGKVNHVAKLLLNVISDSEVWLGAFLQLSSYCLKNPMKGLVKAGCLRKDHWTELLERVKHDSNFSYFVHSIEFCLLKLGLKYLSIDLPDEALHLAFKMESNVSLLAACRQYARKKKNVMLLNLIDYHKQKSCPGAQSSLVKSMTHLANFS